MTSRLAWTARNVVTQIVVGDGPMFLPSLSYYSATGHRQMHALSQSPSAARLLNGTALRGASLGHGHLLFSGHVLSLTRPGELRMPNGLECELPPLEAGSSCRIGGGCLVCDAGTVYPGPVWDPRPQPRFRVCTRPRLSPQELQGLAGCGPGMTPLGDDILTGYLGACALFEADDVDAPALAAELATRTTSLSGTLLRLAAIGHLPEAAHRLLEHGDPEPLLSWGSTSGSGLLAGLGLFPMEARTTVVRSLDVTLPLDPPCVVHIEILERPLPPPAIRRACGTLYTPDSREWQPPAPA